MFAKYITRLKLRRIVKRLQKQRGLMRQRPESRDQSEHGHDAVWARDPQVKTYIYGNAIETGEWK